jgi:Transcriptional antiterminator
MNSLTARQKFILNSIIEKGPLTTKGLSQQIDVSERTVLRETSAINEWLVKYNTRVSESGGKLLIDGDKATLDRVRERLGGIPLSWLLTQDQRQALITAQLLLSAEPVKSAYFSYQFNVVEGTISLYLDKIEQWLKVRNLNLVRRRGYGIEIEGSDWNKRNAFVELLYNYKSMDELLTFLYDKNLDHSLKAFFKFTFGEDLISTIRELLKKIEDKKILKSDDVGYFAAFLHLLLAVKRTNSGFPIELPDHLVSDILSSGEFSFVKDIDIIFKESGINLPESELAYLAIHLNGDKYIYKDNREFEELGVNIEDMAKEVIYLVGKRLNIRITPDNQLMIGLTQHFNPALYRLSMGLQVRNPIINQIKDYYTDLFDAVDYSCKLVFSKYNLTIPSNEVGYVTMHIGAAIERQHALQGNLSTLIICPSGIGTARILSSKLKSNFPEIGNIDVCSLRDMNEKISKGYDLILSTVSIDPMEYKDIISVSPFLQKGDIENIGMAIKERTAPGGDLNKYAMPSAMLSMDETKEDFDTANDILKNFQLKNIDAGSFEKAIIAIVNEIYSTHTEESRKGIESLIYKREEQGHVVIPGSHMALIHVRSDEIEYPFVGVYRLKKFIKLKSVGFSTENIDTFLVMLARKNEINYILELLGKISMSLVENKKFAETLRLGVIKDIRNALIQILNREE